MLIAKLLNLDFPPIWAHARSVMRGSLIFDVGVKRANGLTDKKKQENLWNII